MSKAGNLYVYGDSYADVSKGRQKTNGPVWSQRVAQRWNLDLESFATYGARACRSTDPSAPSLAGQVESFLRSAPSSSKNDDNQEEQRNVHAFFIGVTDVTNSTKFESLTLIGCVKQQVSTIHQRDPTARILLFGLPPLDSAPFYGKNNASSGDAVQRIRERVDAFNVAMEDAASDLKDDVGEGAIAFSDNNFLFAGILGDPSAYGLQDVENAYWDQCQGRCTDAVNDYLWWDTIHLTGAGHKAMADAVVTANPFGYTVQQEPGSDTSSSSSSWLPSGATDDYLYYAPALLIVTALIMFMLVCSRRFPLAGLLRPLLARPKHKYTAVPV
ncbi:hypothetical protein BC940DRAFT_309313 [Gongronella butleri]|nr:hypothetical protein BC940DRAFT_309313 [Gongronella butleri]